MVGVGIYCEDAPPAMPRCGNTFEFLEQGCDVDFRRAVSACNQRGEVVELEFDIVGGGCCRCGSGKEL